VVAVESSVCIDAPAPEVWARLARLEDIRLWSEVIVGARCAAGLDHGVGAERTCRLSGGMVIRERWLAWEEGRSITYEGVGVPSFQAPATRGPFTERANERF
jgi:Polyketide cyclase / dehydrase and lipid transport